MRHGIRGMGVLSTKLPQFLNPAAAVGLFNSDCMLLNYPVEHVIASTGVRLHSPGVSKTVTVYF